MAAPEILVTGASGGGSTGNHVARMLLERGIPVRAFVHRDDERSNNIRALGAEIIEGDLLDLQSVRDAMRGIRRAYFNYAVQDGLKEAHLFTVGGPAASVPRRHRDRRCDASSPALAEEFGRKPSCRHS